MKFATHAIVPNHILAIIGDPMIGWQVVKQGTIDSRLIEFTLSVQDDGAGHFLLVYSSLNGEFSADTWHETLEEAFGCAESELGVVQTEWVHVDQGSKD